MNQSAHIRTPLFGRGIQRLRSLVGRITVVHTHIAPQRIAARNGVLPPKKISMSTAQRRRLPDSALTSHLHLGGGRLAPLTGHHRQLVVSALLLTLGSGVLAGRTFERLLQYHT